MKKSTHIIIRCTEQFKKNAEKKADKLGLSLSGYLTMLIKKDSENDKN